MWVLVLLNLNWLMAENTIKTYDDFALCRQDMNALNESKFKRGPDDLFICIKETTHE